MTKASKKLLTKRVNFPSVPDLIDEALPNIQEKFSFNEKQTEEMMIGLTRLLSNFLSEIKSALELGASKGMEEAIALILDPEYYETIKNRRKNTIKQNKEWRVKQEAEDAERKYRQENPTYNDKERIIINALSEMFYNKENYHKAKDKIFNITEKDGNQILIQTIKKRFRFPDIWFESFDVDEFIEQLKRKKVSEKKSDDDDDFFDKGDILSDD